jgi:hypothetical protein
MLDLGLRLHGRRVNLVVSLAVPLLLSLTRLIMGSLGRPMYLLRQRQLWSTSGRQSDLGKERMDLVAISNWICAFRGP